MSEYLEQLGNWLEGFDAHYVDTVLSECWSRVFVTTPSVVDTDETL